MTEPRKWLSCGWNSENQSPQSATKVALHDVTLRDGEQQAGLSFDRSQRIAIGKALSAAGVERIEVGVPYSSDEDRAVASELAASGLAAKVFVFSGNSPGCVGAAVGCGAQGILVKMVTSDHLLHKGYSSTLEKEKAASIATLREAREAGLYTVLFAIDATRTPLPHLLDIAEQSMIESGADSFAVADSYGVAGPDAISVGVSSLRERLSKPVEIHCHDDYGLAVANTLAGIAAGASVAQVTVTGVGERAGNASLESTVMALKCLYNVQTGVSSEHLFSLSELVQQSGRFALPSNRSVVGHSLCDIESGVVAMLFRRCREKDPLECMPFLPEVAGHPRPRIVLGKASGVENVREHLEIRNLKMAPLEEALILTEVRRLAESSKRILTSEQFDSILLEVAAVDPQRLSHVIL